MKLDQRRQSAALRGLTDMYDRLRPALDTMEGNNTYSRGFFVRQERTKKPDVIQSWESIEFGEWAIDIFPGQKCLKSDRPSGETVVIIGNAFESGPKGATDKSVASKVAKVCGDKANDRLFDYIETLSGRFAILVSTGSGMKVFNDPMGAQAVFWHKSPGGEVSISSHDKLISDAVGPLGSEEAKWFLNNPDYVSPAGKALPGLVTGHDDVSPLFPNCYLEVIDGNVNHHRFYPRKPLPELSKGEALDIMHDELVNQTSMWLSLPGPVIVGLTAGGDSKTLLGTNLVGFQDRKAYCLTYHFFSNNNESTYADLSKANRRAAAARMPHLIFDVGALEPGTPEARLYNSTFSGWARFPSLAAAFYRNVPWESTFFMSVGGEVGTGFYRDRSRSMLDPTVMASKYTYTQFSNNPRVIESMERYAEYVELGAVAAGGTDLHDLFYTEHRLGKWASLWYAEMDLSTRTALPMNSRRMFEAMQSQPFDYRVSGQLYRDYWERYGLNRIDG